METNSIVNKIIFLPTTFSHQNISIYTLLKNTGYFDLFNQIEEKEVLHQLLQHPECVEQWLIWSADKRVSSGWYFKKKRTQGYIVGFYPETGAHTDLQFDDSVKACAAFIKREIEEIRNRQ